MQSLEGKSYLMFMLKYIFRIYEDRLYSKLPYPTWKLNYHYLDIIKYTYKKSFYTRDRWFTLILEELVWICFKLYSYRNQIVPLRGWIYNNLSAKETPNNVWDFMPKVGKCIFTEVQIVLHQMQCSETQFFVVYLSVTREPNVHRIQRITQLPSARTMSQTGQNMIWRSSELVVCQFIKL